MFASEGRAAAWKMPIAAAQLQIMPQPRCGARKHVDGLYFILTN